MPKLYLPWAPYDLFDGDFPYGLSGIVYGYGLQRVCLHFIRSLTSFDDGLVYSRRDPSWILYGYLAVIVCLSSRTRKNRTKIRCGDRAEARCLSDDHVVLGIHVPNHALQGDRATTLQYPRGAGYDHHAILVPNDHLNLRSPHCQHGCPVARTGIVRCSYDMSTGYGLMILYNAELMLTSGLQRAYGARSMSKFPFYGSMGAVA